MSAAWQAESQRLVVKHTFLEFVDKEQGTGRAGRLRAFTDSALEPQFAPAPVSDRSVDSDAFGEEPPIHPEYQDERDPPADGVGFLSADPLSAATAAQVRDIASPQRGRSRCGSEADAAQPSSTNSFFEPSSRTNTTLDLDSAVTTNAYVSQAPDAQQATRGACPPLSSSSAAASSGSAAPAPMRPQDFGPLMQFWMAMQASAVGAAAMGASSSAASDTRPPGSSGPDAEAASKPRRRSNKEGVGVQATGSGQARPKTAMNDSAPQSPQLQPVQARLQPPPGSPAYETMLQASAMLMQQEMQARQGQLASASRTPVHAVEPTHAKGRNKIQNKNTTKATVDTRPRRQASDASDSTLAPMSGDSAADALVQDSSKLTTVMLRNLPNRYTRDMLLQMLDSEGFIGRYTFVYLPIDFKTHSGLGYAFVDLVLPEDAVRLRERFEGFSRWAIQSEKICSVGWSAPAQQGLHAHVDRYRNSPVMHFSVSDEWKPAVFANGQRVPFPPPTRRLRAPNLRVVPQSGKSAGDVLG